VCPQDKIEAIACGTYGAAGVSYSPEAEEAIQVGMLLPPTPSLLSFAKALSELHSVLAVCHCHFQLSMRFF
jgi:hypothetical protein